MSWIKSQVGGCGQQTANLAIAAVDIPAEGWGANLAGMRWCRRKSVLATIESGEGCEWVKDVKDAHGSTHRQESLEPRGEKPAPPGTCCRFTGLVFGQGMTLHTLGWGCRESSPTAGISRGGMSPAEPVPNAGLLLFQVSKAAADLMAYCEAHAKEDPLLTPVPASENPFREKKFFCVIL